MKYKNSIVALALAFAAQAASADNSSGAVKRNLDTFNAIYKNLQSTYVDTIDAKKSMRTAINAMLSSLDPYNEYIPQEDLSEFMTISTGQFGGIGAVIRQLKSGVTIIDEPQEDTPAARAGLRAGDKIITIDGDTVTSIGVDKVRERLRGQAGIPLTINISRPHVGADSSLTINLTRAQIDVHTLPYYGVVADSVGYIALSTYNEKSVPEVKAALTELLADKRVGGIILDLRGNGGGLMESAVDLVSLFVPKGTEVLRTKGRGGSEKIYRTTSKPVSTDIPLAVLIDEDTASSAEITAGALQDLDRAVVIGRRSYGKGLVQSTRRLPNNELLKLTTMRYYIPSGRCIQAIDYAHRNADGSAYHVPDSLTSVFHTAAGREVRDGGGITPDIKIEAKRPSTIAYRLVVDDWIFDFANKYFATHDSIASPSEFVLTDEIYADFKDSLDPEKLASEKLFDKYIEEFEKSIKEEGYLSDEVKNHFDELRRLLAYNLDRDLEVKHDEIADYLAKELLQRYYFRRGTLEYMTRTDETVGRAKQVLTSPDEYSRILSSNKQTSKP